MAVVVGGGVVIAVVCVCVYGVVGGVGFVVVGSLLKVWSLLLLERFLLVFFLLILRSFMML